MYLRSRRVKTIARTFGVCFIGHQSLRREVEIKHSAYKPQLASANVNATLFSQLPSAHYVCTQTRCTRVTCTPYSAQVHTESGGPQMDFGFLVLLHLCGVHPLPIDAMQRMPSCSELLRATATAAWSEWLLRQKHVGSEETT